MKLTLRPDGDIQILSASDALSARDCDVLKAGITKLFKTGKNKIILELKEPKTLPTEVIRELAVLNLLAHELSGNIFLSGLDTPMRAQVASFSKPPVVTCFEKTEEALKAFRHPEPVPAPKPVPTVAAPATRDDIKKEAASELSGRKETEALREENHVLKAELLARMNSRRMAPGAQAYEEKISHLESQMTILLRRVRELEPK